MTVYTNRIRRAYLRHRSSREMLLGPLLVSGVMACCGIVGVAFERDAKQISAMIWPIVCCHVVGGTQGLGQNNTKLIAPDLKRQSVAQY